MSTIQGMRLAAMFLTALAATGCGRAVAADWKPDKRVEIVEALNSCIKGETCGDGLTLLTGTP